MTHNVEHLLNPDTVERLRSLSEPGAVKAFDELIAMYLEDTLKLMNDLKRALVQRNGSKLCHLAHTLRGSSGNLGAERLAAVCRDLENRSKSGQLEGAAVLVDRLEEEFFELKKALVAEES